MDFIHIFPIVSTIPLIGKENPRCDIVSNCHVSSVSFHLGHFLSLPLLFMTFTFWRVQVSHFADTLSVWNCLPSGQKCHPNDADFFPVQHIWRHVLGSVTGNVDFDHEVKKSLPGLSTVTFLFTLRNSQISCVEIL